MARVLYVATANFGGRGKDKKARRRRRKNMTWGGALKLGATLGVIEGIGQGGLAGYLEAQQYLNSPRFRQFVANKASQGQLNPGDLDFMINAAKPIGVVSGAVKQGLGYGLAGAAVGAGVYGIKKAIDRKKRTKKIFGKNFTIGK